MPIGTHTPDQVEGIPMYSLYGSPSNSVDVNAGIDEPLQSSNLEKGMFKHPSQGFSDSSTSSATTETGHEACTVILPLWSHQ